MPGAFLLRRAPRSLLTLTAAILLQPHMAAGQSGGPPVPASASKPLIVGELLVPKGDIQGRYRGPATKIVKREEVPESFRYWPVRSEDVTLVCFRELGWRSHIVVAGGVPFGINGKTMRMASTYAAELTIDGKSVPLRDVTVPHPVIASEQGLADIFGPMLQKMGCM